MAPEGLSPIASMVWGDVPDESQRSAFRRMVGQVVHDARPPLPQAYAVDLIEAIMVGVDDWDWWKARWYFVRDE